MCASLVSGVKSHTEVCGVILKKFFKDVILKHDASPQILNKYTISKAFFYYLSLYI